MEINQIRQSWVEILYVLERKNHTAWLAFFDARLAEFNNSTLTLDFSDSRKFASAHEYGNIRSDHVKALEAAIKEVLGADIQVIEKK